MGVPGEKGVCGTVAFHTRGAIHAIGVKSPLSGIHKRLVVRMLWSPLKWHQFDFGVGQGAVCQSCVNGHAWGLGGFHGFRRRKKR